MNIFRRFGPARAALAIGLFAISHLVAAAVITYAFTAAGGHFGSFSFDDTNTVTVGVPPGMKPSGSFYDAMSFSVDGATIASPVMGVYDNVVSGPSEFDCIDVLPAAGFPGATLVEFCATPATLFSGQALSVADNLQLSDFNSDHVLQLPSGVIVDILTLSRVPEPATLALIGLGLSGLALTRRRRAH